MGVDNVSHITGSQSRPRGFHHPLPSLIHHAVLACTGHRGWVVDMFDVYPGLVVTREYSSQNCRTVLLNWDLSGVYHFGLNKVDLKRK